MKLMLINKDNPLPKDYKIIRRKGKVMVICQNPKHKQKQG